MLPVVLVPSVYPLNTATKHLDSRSPRRRTSRDVRSGSAFRHVLPEAQQATKKGPVGAHVSHASHAKYDIFPENYIYIYMYYDIYIYIPVYHYKYIYIYIQAVKTSPGEVTC